MPTYVMLSTLGPDGSATLRDHPERIREVNRDVESMGVKVLQQYALLGNWDFLNILEAPDEVTMARVATRLAARGTLKTVTLTAIPIDDFVAALSDGAAAAGGSSDSAGI
jgi:uncharacterized protein with GYD domain